MGKRKNSKREILFTCVLLILVLVILYSGLRILESTVLLNKPWSEDTERKTITVDGVDYFPRQDITVLMVLGIDKFGEMESSGYYRNDGDADMIMLLVLDETEKKCDILTLNRDTMVNMSVLGVRGEQAGTAYGQLALAYTYGSGLDDSCENMKQMVSTFLLGAEIDYYISMSMDAIPLLNDAVGGVTVEVTDDFSALDPSIGMGTVTLRGQQAINFVRTRKDLGDQLNMSRLERHKAYMNGFLNALKDTRQNALSDIVTAYREAAPYIVTNCSTNTVTMLMEQFSDYALGEIYAPSGENILGQEYYEYHADEKDVTALALKLFFAEK